MATKSFSALSTILYKRIFLAILFFILAYMLFYQLQLENMEITLNPNSDKNNYLTKLNLVLNTADIETYQFVLRSFQNEVEFLINNNSTTKVVLSTQKDPYQQVASLQQILKIARINGNDVKFIDLSIGRPYATL